MPFGPILAGRFTGVDTNVVSFNPKNKNFLYGYYNIKDLNKRKKHLSDLSRRFNIKPNPNGYGLSKMLSELIDNPFQYDREEK